MLINFGKNIRKCGLPLDHPPIVHVFFDDVQGTPVFGRGKKGADGVILKCVDDVVIKHKHLG
jgi:hypothetical protein